MWWNIQSIWQFQGAHRKKVLPRYKEWSLKERIENSLPNHNQNTTNYVEYSFRMTKDVQFSCLRVYNLVDLLSVCLDDSKFYTRRCTDVSHSRNYLLFTNQKLKNWFKTTKLDFSKIIQLSRSEYLVPSENIEDKWYKANIDHWPKDLWVQARCVERPLQT